MKVQVMVLMEALVHQTKKFSINFSEAKTKVWLILHYNHNNNYCLFEKKTLSKANNKNVNFPTQFV